ncbi:hypothetical protein AAF712_010903 [Marasmius tenuissimus]|uniref:Prolyl 4-hydroxylase alpha subunit Fe(2+) 2OG dioxygenase domain-containing protein n=1 Tax=Marasmius tenuissimus TaxID=585030 RepID=A0ABR2ZMG6_9AGAR
MFGQWNREGATARAATTFDVTQAVLAAYEDEDAPDGVVDLPPLEGLSVEDDETVPIPARPSGPDAGRPALPRSENARKHAQRAIKRAKLDQETGGSSGYRPNYGHHISGPGQPSIEAEMDSNVFHEATAGYIGKERVAQGDGRVWSLAELKEKGFRYQAVDSECTTPILDRNDTIMAVLIAPPKGDPTWENVVSEAAHCLEDTREKLSFSKKCLQHRRGEFPVQPIGVSYGGGQEYPKRIYHNNNNRKLLEGLIGRRCFRRLAGHASAGFATWAPPLYDEYVEYKERLRQSDPSLRFNFTNSIWSCTTFNFGPKTVTVQHVDHLNYIYGWCGITALGSFDFRKGGHFVLWDLELVLEFPAGWTILLPSAYIRHSNTPIGRSETRYSFTQYTAGGLFRWVDDGFKARSKMSEDEKKEAQKIQRQKLRKGLNLYCKLGDLKRIYKSK